MKKRIIILIGIWVLAILLIGFFIFYAAKPIINARATDTATISLFIEADTISPSVVLIAPADGYSSTNNQVTFQFNATDDSGIKNCSLMINGDVAQTLTSVVNGAISSFSGTFSKGQYSWSVNCRDTSGNQGNSTTRMFTIKQAGGGGGGESPGYGPGIYNMTKGEFISGYMKNLSQGQRMNFKVGEIWHRIIVIIVERDYIIVEVRSTPQRVKMYVGDEKIFDVNEDGINDTSVKLNSIDYENRWADITVKEIFPPEEQPSLQPPIIGKEEIELMFIIGLASALIAVAFSSWALWEELVTRTRVGRLKRKLREQESKHEVAD